MTDIKLRLLEYHRHTFVLGRRNELNDAGAFDDVAANLREYVAVRAVSKHALLGKENAFALDTEYLATDQCKVP